MTCRKVSGRLPPPSPLVPSPAGWRLSRSAARPDIWENFSKCFGFFETRSQVIWQFREALDPNQDGGSPIALPNDQALMADLTAPTFEVGSRGIKVETKEEIVRRLGRSPDRGDAAVMAWLGSNHRLREEHFNSSRRQKPEVITMKSRRRSRRR